MGSASMIETTVSGQTPNWHFKADYVETCNCDFGCPCIALCIVSNLLNQWIILSLIPKTDLMK